MSFFIKNELVNDMKPLVNDMKPLMLQPQSGLLSFSHNSTVECSFDVAKHNVNFTINETHLVINENGQTVYAVHPPNRQFYSCFTSGKKAIIQFPHIILQLRHADGSFQNIYSCRLSLIFTRAISYYNLLVQLTNAGYSMTELTKYRK
uniref:Uncharacterized protein n=1 Tax=Panagrolaimus sp. JU765 TaxID=591449 RepID=A0AC34QUU3_9BILA